MKLKSSDWQSPSVTVAFVKPYSVTDDPRFTLTSETDPKSDTQVKVEVTLNRLEALTLVHYIMTALGG